MNNTITEMKNILEGINSRITDKWADKWPGRKNGGNHTEEQNKEKRMKRNEDSFRDLWDNIKFTNIHIIGVPEGEERERTWENIWSHDSWKLP